MTTRLLLAGLGLAICVTRPALAHHAFAAEFDADLPIRVQGKIVRVEWINPHAWIHVAHKNMDGTTTIWHLEASTPNTLLRRGLTRTVLKVGREVVVRGYQSKDQICDPACTGSGRDITFRSGLAVFMGSSGTGAPHDGADPAASVAGADEPVAADADDRAER